MNEKRRGKKLSSFQFHTRRIADHSTMDLSKIFARSNTAVITGASSGIGRAAALSCARSGMHVWLLDVDAAELADAAALVRSSRATTTAADADDARQHVQPIVVDVSDEQGMNDAAAGVFGHASTRTVHFLMNNAAVQRAGGGPLDTDMDAFRRVMDVNALGPVIGCRAFVPGMQERGEDGLVVNTGSKQGITAPPGNLTYNVSKAALRTWTEGLEHELRTRRAEGGGRLRAALLIPGWTNTSILLKEERRRAAAGGRLDEFDEGDVFFHEDKPAGGAWMPAEVVDFMMREIASGKFYIVCPDNDMDRETDNLRMTWAMQDITEDRPPLSRWHPEWKDKFADYLKQNKK